MRTPTFLRPRKALALIAAVFWGTLAVSAESFASKVEAGFGYFMMNVNNGATSSTIAAPGLGYVIYRHPLPHQLEIGGGFTILMPDGFGNEKGFGFDLNLSYYPFSMHEPSEIHEGNVQMQVWDTWRPFVSTGIQQRNVQAKSVPIAPTLFGPGLGIGTERSIQNDLSLRAEVTYYRLIGPAAIGAGQVDMKLGVSLRF